MNLLWSGTDFSTIPTLYCPVFCDRRTSPTHQFSFSCDHHSPSSQSAGGARREDKEGEIEAIQQLIEIAIDTLATITMSHWMTSGRSCLKANFVLGFNHTAC
jgi:hypothetical protein